MKLSIIILTRNEAKNLKDCIASTEDLADEIDLDQTIPFVSRPVLKSLSHIPFFTKDFSPFFQKLIAESNFLYSHFSKNNNDKFSDIF